MYTCNILLKDVMNDMLPKLLKIRLIWHRNKQKHKTKASAHILHAINELILLSIYLYLGCTVCFSFYFWG